MSNGKREPVTPDGAVVTGKPQPQCRGCGTTGNEEYSLRRCSNCRCVVYCSKSCQKKDREDHEVLCNAIHTLQAKVDVEKGIYDTRVMPKTKAAVVKLVGNRCIMKGTLDDVEVNLLYDTGAQVCLIDKNWLEENGKTSKDIRTIG